jgi:hypothetical protein
LVSVDQEWEAVDSAMGTLSLQIPVMLFLLFY